MFLVTIFFQEPVLSEFCPVFVSKTLSEWINVIKNSKKNIKRYPKLSQHVSERSRARVA